MSSANPYRSPHSSGEARHSKDATHFRRPPYVWTAILMFVGVCFLLLLNGQVFTNACVFLICTALSAAIWIRHALGMKTRHRPFLVRMIILTHFAVLLVFALGLPDNYRWQQQFNNRDKEIPAQAP